MQLRNIFGLLDFFTCYFLDNLKIYKTINLADPNYPIYIITQIF